jgi:hypothetical protein
MSGEGRKKLGIRRVNKRGPNGKKKIYIYMYIYIYIYMYIYILIKTHIDIVFTISKNFNHTHVPPGKCAKAGREGDRGGVGERRKDVRVCVCMGSECFHWFE